MEERQRELAERLGGYRTGAGPELRALVEATAGEPLAAAVIGVWRKRGWVVVATARSLHMSRQPRVMGRKRTLTWAWSDLREMRTGAGRVDFAFPDETLELRVLAPHAEFVRLIDTAREASSVPTPEMRIEELRELAKVKLGRILTAASEAAIDSLGDQLLPGERVERLATATLDFDGMLVVTDRRLLLTRVGLKRDNDRFWETGRDQIVGAAEVDNGLRVDLRDGPVTFADVLPEERRGELAAALWRG